MTCRVQLFCDGECCSEGSAALCSPQSDQVLGISRSRMQLCLTPMLKHVQCCRVRAVKILFRGGPLGLLELFSLSCDSYSLVACNCNCVAFQSTADYVSIVIPQAIVGSLLVPQDSVPVAFLVCVGNLMFPQSNAAQCIPQNIPISR